MEYYRITKVLHSGVDGERETPRTDGRYPLRVGRIVLINKQDLHIGHSFWLQYVVDENGKPLHGSYKRTSYVVRWECCSNLEDTLVNKLRIETYRTIYEFEEFVPKLTLPKLTLENEQKKGD